MMPKNKIPFPDQPPSGSGKRGDPTKNCASCDCAIELSNKKLLIPLGIVLYANGKINLGPNPQNEWCPGISPTSQSLIAQPGVYDDPEGELVDFMVSIDCSEKKIGEPAIDAAEIEIRDSENKSIYHEDLSTPKKRPFHERNGKPDYLTKGKHRWQWDGYDDNDILDTARLKKGKNKILLKITYNGIQAICEKNFTCEPKDSDWSWIDIKIDRINKTISALWRLNLTDMSNNAVNQNLIALAIKGIAMHFSRHIKRYLIQDEEYIVTSTAINNADPKMPKHFNLEVDKTGKKSSISAGNAVIYYDPTRLNKKSSNAEFHYLAAHECGHIVLKLAYPSLTNTFSWTHKGTTSLFQSYLKDSPQYRIGNPTDLMWYYLDVRPYKSWELAIAGKEDMRGLIYLSQIKFK